MLQNRATDLSLGALWDENDKEDLSFVG